MHSRPCWGVIWGLISCNTPTASDNLSLNTQELISLSGASVLWKRIKWYLPEPWLTHSTENSCASGLYRPHACSNSRDHLSCWRNRIAQLDLMLSYGSVRTHSRFCLSPRVFPHLPHILRLKICSEWQERITHHVRNCETSSFFFSFVVASCV